MKDKRIELRGAIWMTVRGESFGGTGRMTLLEKIAELGSITQAAKTMGMSYKAAWDAVDMMNNMAGESLVERVAGGKGGGGTRLTQRGEQLIRNFRLIEREHRRFVDLLGYQANGIADDMQLLERIDVETSARNQFIGTVAAVLRGTVTSEIELALPSGQSLVATVARADSEQLDLRPGTELIALVQPSSVVIAVDDADVKLSARNRWAGVVARLAADTVNVEVVLDLAGGGSIAATITRTSCEALQLAIGKPATAIFKTSSVVLGAPA